MKSTNGEHLWGEDAEAVEAAVKALFGHHPERGGSERAQAAYAVVQAVKPIIIAQKAEARVIQSSQDEQFDLSLIREEDLVTTKGGKPMDDFTYKVLRLMAKHDAQDELLWTFNGDEIHFYIDCSDIFWWATSDSEQITQANLAVLDKAYEDSVDQGGLLFCARVRNLRPQGAAYGALNFSDEDAAHFDAAGPERDVDFSNPVKRDGEWAYPRPTGQKYPEYRKTWEEI